MTTAITLPLDTVEHLLTAAKEYARQWSKSGSPIEDAIATTEREVAEVRRLMKENEDG